MKVLYIIPYFVSWGGPAQVVEQVAARMTERGHAATIFTTDTGPDNKRVKIPDRMGNLTIESFPNLSAWGARQQRAFFPPRYFYEFGDRVREFDLVHIVEYRHLLGVWAARGAGKRGIPIVLSPHGSLPNGMQRVRLKQIFDMVFGRRALTRIDRFHALTEEERAFMVSLGLSEKKISVIPNGVEVPELPEEKEREKAREKWGVGPDDVLALFMARLHKEKGLDTLLSALAMTGKPTIKLIVAGPDDGVLDSALAFVKENNLTDRVFFPGFLQGDEKRAAFAAADIFTSLSNYETMPVAVLEGMSYARPVLVSGAVAAVVQGLHDGDVGHVVETGNPRVAAQALEQLADDGEARRRMGMGGRRLVEQSYTWDRIVDAYLALYTGLA